MDYPMGSARAAGKIVTREFKGLSHAAVGSEGCFADCENLSAEYPVIHTASGFFAPDTQYDSVQAVIKPHGASGFCGVAGGVLYWNGAAVSAEEYANYTIKADSEIKLYTMGDELYVYEKRTGGRVVLYRYNIYDSAKDKYSVCFQVAGSVCFYMLNGNLQTVGTGFSISGLTVHVTGPENNEERFMRIAKKDYEVPENEPVYAETTSSGEKVMSGGIVLGYREQINFKNAKGKIVNPLCDISNGERVEVGGLYTKGQFIPQITRPEIYKNRVWGGMIDGSSVIATSLGSGYDFYSFQNTAADSVELNVPAPGPFIGLKAFADALLCFKKNSITVIYGDTAYDFSVGKTIHGVGTIDIRSAAEVDGALYFCSGDGFYAYVGGQPEFISPNIRASYKACIAFSQNGKYYAEGTLADGTREMLTYDVRTGIWLREAAQGIKYVCDDEGDVLIACASGVKKHRREYDYADNSPSWYLESQDLYESIYEKKGISEIFIRARLEKGTEMTVSTVSADGVRTKHKTFCGNGKITTYRVPVKYEKQEAYRYRISGVGAALIYDIERTLPAGGRNIGG